MMPAGYIRATRDRRLRGADRRVLAECYAILSADEWRSVPDWHVGDFLGYQGTNVRRSLRRLVAFGHLLRDTPALSERRQDRRYRLPAESISHAA